MNLRLAACAVLFLASFAHAEELHPLWIHGRVKLPAGAPLGQPVEILVRSGDPHAPLAGSVLASVEADPDGGFGLVFDAREQGFFLALESRWLALRPLWIDARPGECSIEVELEPQLVGILHGRFADPTGAVDPAGELRGSWVWIEGPELLAAEVDGEGEFELRGPAEALRGLLCARPHEFSPVLVEAPPALAGTQCECVLALLEPAELRGRLVDSAHRGVSGVTLSFWRGFDARAPLVLDPWGSVQSFTSAEDGSFEAPGLPAGELALRVESPHWRLLDARVGGLAPGETRAGLELVLLRAGSLRGVVADAAGEPVAGARVTAGARETEGGLMVTTTDAQGRYAFDAALPGAYVLSASFEGSAAHSAGVIALEEGGRSSADLVLGRGSLLRIDLGDRAAPVHLSVRDALGFLRADQRVWQGALELALPPGLYRVEITGADGSRGERKLLLTGRERGALTLRL